MCTLGVVLVVACLAVVVVGSTAAAQGETNHACADLTHALHEMAVIIDALGAAVNVSSSQSPGMLVTALREQHLTSTAQLSTLCVVRQRRNTATEDSVNSTNSTNITNSTNSTNAANNGTNNDANPNSTNASTKSNLRAEDSATTTPGTTSAPTTPVSETTTVDPATPQGTEQVQVNWCRIDWVLTAQCHLRTPPIPHGALIIEFNTFGQAASRSANTKPTEATAAAFRALIDDYQPRNLTLRSTQRITSQGASIFPSDLVWVLNEANWDSVSNLSISGLVSTTFALNSLNHFPNLTTLSIAGNRINQLTITTERDPSPFAATPHLEVLDVRDNSLSRLQPTLLRGMSSLRVLNLTNNYITAIEAGVFRDTTALQHLWLSLNHISRIDPGVFTGLRHLCNLTLQDNQLRTLPESAFHGATQLHRLILSNNPLDELPPLLLANGANLRVFEAANTFLDALPEQLFAATARLHRLVLMNARITQMPPRVFSNLGSLYYLSMSGNRMLQLHPDLLQGLNQLRRVFFSRNRLTSLPAGFFRDQHNLTYVGFGHNLLQVLPSTLFENNAKLAFITLNGNKLTDVPVAMLRNKPELASLYLTNNLLTGLPVHAQAPSNSGAPDATTAGIALPSLQILDLSFNPIEVLPPPHVMPNLTTLRAIHHRMSTIHMTPLLSLRRLTRLELASDPARPTSALAFTAEEAEHDTAPPTLRFLDLRNVELSTAFVQFAYQQQLRLRHINLGWPGMSDRTAPMAQICDLLDREVEYVGLHNTAYRRIELCQDKRILSVGLEDNPRLEHLTLLHNLNRLNVSGCTSLRDMTLLSADILDISGTRLMFQPPLCDTWGTRVVVARGIALASNHALEDVGSHIQHCLSHVELLDLSDNGWLNQVQLVETPPIVVSDVPHWSEDFGLDIASNAIVPVFVINAGKVSCTLQLGETQARPRTDNERITTEVTFQFNCRCAQRFVQRDGKCVPDELTTGEIAAISMGVVMVVGAVLAVVYQHYRRRRRTLEVENKTVYSHLLEKEEEVMALKKVWEIDFGELHLVTRIDKDSEGAFGEVWLARWDELTVATKLLKRSVLLFDESQREEFEKEVEFLQRTRHPHVVRFFGAGTDPHGSPFLVLEFVAMGSLQALLRRDLAQVLVRAASEADVRPSTSDTLTIAETEEEVMVQAASAHAPADVWALKLRFARDVACGMAFIHSLGHVHRDLKSGNVLVSSALRAKISDFGCIREVLTQGQRQQQQQQQQQQQRLAHGVMPVDAVQSPTLTVGVGTPLYMAPEVLAGREYDGKADVFSFGVLLWEVAMQRVPDLVEQELGPGKRGCFSVHMLELLTQGKRLKFTTTSSDAKENVAEGISTPLGDASTTVRELQRPATRATGLSCPTLSLFAAVADSCVAHTPANRPAFEELEKRFREALMQGVAGQ